MQVRSRRRPDHQPRNHPRLLHRRLRSLRSRIRSRRKGLAMEKEHSLTVLTSRSAKCILGSMAVLGRTKKDVILEFRTTEILEAARTVFASRGFDGATIDAIALTAGVAKGTVYLYFDSKRDLFLASMREGVLALHEEVSAAMNAATTCEAK